MTLHKFPIGSGPAYFVASRRPRDLKHEVSRILDLFDAFE
jgi:hypothetical protein